MAGLNDFLSNKAMQQTTLPSWFDTAQQNVVNQAQSAFGAAPTPQQTVAQGAVTTMGQPTTPFQQAAGTLQNIASGAANPWIVNQQTGQVTPNTATALGGLFQAQNQQLQQLMPNITAPVQGANIASGQFGSLRGQTAVNKAMADAQSKLFADQMQAALQGQQIGTQAGLGAGQLTAQDIENALRVGQYQQAAPFMNVSNLGKVVGGIQAPATVYNQTQLSPLNQIAGLATVLGGQTGQGGILGQLGVPGGLQGLFKGIGNKLGLGGYGGSGLTPGLNAGTYPLQGGGQMVIGQDGSRIIQEPDGNVTAYDASGNPLGGSTNAGDVGPGGITYEDLFNPERGYNTYTPEQLDQYQNYYDNLSSGGGGGGGSFDANMDFWG